MCSQALSHLMPATAQVSGCHYYPTFWRRASPTASGNLLVANLRVKLCAQATVQTARCPQATSSLRAGLESLGHPAAFKTIHAFDHRARKTAQAAVCEVKRCPGNVSGGRTPESLQGNRLFPEEEVISLGAPMGPGWGGLPQPAASTSGISPVHTKTTGRQSSVRSWCPPAWSTLPSSCSLMPGPGTKVIQRVQIPGNLLEIYF